MSNRTARRAERLTPDQIRSLRLSTGQTQRAFATTLGVAVETLNKWEAGTVAITVSHERFVRLFVDAGAPAWVAESAVR